MRMRTYILLFFLEVFYSALAQQPGGIPDPLLWLTAEQNHTADLKMNTHPATDIRTAGWYSAVDSVVQSAERFTLFAVVLSDGDTPTARPKVLTYLSSMRARHSIWYEEDRPATNLSFLKGYCPESIIYDRILSPLDCRRVESYLAIKYGITLGSSYYGSDGQMLWDRDELRDYHHRIIALGWDADNRLQQHESAGVGADSLILSVCRTDTTDIVSGSYLLIGDNDGSTQAVADEDSPWHVCGRQWVVCASSDTLRSATSRQVYAKTQISITFPAGDSGEFMKVDMRRIFLLVDDSRQHDKAFARMTRTACVSRTDGTLTFGDMTWDDINDCRMTLAWYDGDLDDLFPGAAPSQQASRNKRDTNPAGTLASSLGSSRLTVTSDGTANAYTARLTTPARCDATLAVFSTNGVKIIEKTFCGGHDRSLTFTLPGSGMYVVKAITPDEELTEKIIRK